MDRPEDHDPFCVTDFDEELKKANARIASTAPKMLENLKNQIQHYLQANNTKAICIHLDVHADGQWGFTFKTQPDLQKTLDGIEIGHSQEVQ